MPPQRYTLLGANTPKSRQIYARLGHQNHQPSNEVEGFEDNVRHAVSVRGLQLSRSRGIRASMDSKVDVQIQRTAETLDQGDRTRLHRRTIKAGPRDQVRVNAAVDDAEHLPGRRLRGGSQPGSAIR